MRAELRVTSMILLIAVCMLIASCVLVPAGAQTTEEEDKELQDVHLFVHGDTENPVLNTSYGEGEKHNVLTTNVTDLPTVPIYIGEWITNPIVYPMDIDGAVSFLLFAEGDLAQVTFSAYLTVNGVEVTPEMGTDTQDLNESLPAMFISETVNVTQPLELNNGDVIGFQLWLTHEDPEVIIPPPLGQSKNVTLLMGGYNYPTYVTINTNSMRIENVTGRDDPISGNWIVGAQVKCSFGVEDFDHAGARTKSTYGNRFTMISKEMVDEGTVEIEWEWDYSVSDGGSYPVTITAWDDNFNSWDETVDIHITTPNTEIDFAITESDISFSDDPKKDENTTITVKIKGLGKRWKSYQVEVEFHDGPELIETVKTPITRGTTNEVSILWVPEDTGDHEITVIVDPDDKFDETNEGNNEASKKVKVKTGSGGDGTPGFETVGLLAAVCLAMIILRKPRRLP